MEKLVDARNELVTKSRNLRGEFNIPTNKRVAFLFVPVGQIDPHEVEALRILLTAESVTLTSREEVKQGTPSVSSALCDLFIPLEGLVDVDAEKARLTKELTKIEEEIGKVKAKLANENFVNKVPASVLEEHRLRQADWESKLESTRKNLAALG